MKSRAQLMEHSEDWVDGSWTVDCVCGVNYDDGEEMVDCDECGVWVHTRCSRYVKSEKSFACDKCKIKNSRNISEETEVAQLLVDFPNTTLKLENKYKLNDGAAMRLWPEKPMEDRVHVHGIPGGDPQLFNALSGIFTPHLWKATGYVPKKFSFRYKEFPCWETDDDEKTEKDPQDNSSPVDTGADALYSMSKETVNGTRLRIPLGNRVSGKGENFDSKAYAKEPKSLRHVNADLDYDNEKNTRQSYQFNSNQLRKGLITSQNSNGKRKSKASDTDIDFKKRTRHSSGSVLSTASNPKISEASGVKDSKYFRNNSQVSMKFRESNDAPHSLVLKSKLPNKDSFVKKDEYSKGDNVMEASPSDTDNCNSTIEATQKADKVHCQSSAVIKTDETISSSLINNVEPSSVKKEVCGSVSCFSTDQTKKSADVMMDKADANLSQCFVLPADPHVQGIQNHRDSIVGTCVQTHQLKLELDDLPSTIKLSGDDQKHLIYRSVAGPDAVNCKVDEAAVSSSQCISNTLDLNVNAPVQAENFLETGEATHSPTLLRGQRKIVVSVARPMSTDSMFKSVASDDSRADEIKNSSISNRKKAATTSNINVIKERGSVFISNKGGDKHSKESPRDSESSVWKSSNDSKMSHSHTSKESYSRSKEHASQSFAKAKQDSIATSDSGESAGSLQAQGALIGQSKVTSSGSSGSLQKGRKHSQITNNTASKTSNIASTNRHLLSASHAHLSDEELALLLHQELNSSPRVPRIPRMRQAGSLPQAASPTAATMLSKRTSVFGGNDYTSVFRRKYKDSSEDGIPLSVGLDVKPRKGERGSSSHKQCTNESTSKVDRINKRELDERSSKTYGVKRISTSSINVTKSHSSSHSSLKSVLDEETEIGGSSTYRTLPGLISEIMSKGKRMTYEELCNAVLPHWQNLRKHNGERYAYSSHSQAVLDCLRNRSEWAQLVDRGPKTNPGRKRRKLDAEPATSESEDATVKNKVPILLDNKNLPKHQDFPKGKRQARKRRRHALQCKEVKNLQKSRSAETASEDDGEDDSLYSNSVEQSSASEDEDEDDDQGSESGGTASEVSVSSDES